MWRSRDSKSMPMSCKITTMRSRRHFGQDRSAKECRLNVPDALAFLSLYPATTAPHPATARGLGPARHWGCSKVRTLPFQPSVPKAMGIRKPGQEPQNKKEQTAKYGQGYWAKPLPFSVHSVVMLPPKTVYFCTNWQPCYNLVVRLG